MGSVFVTSAMLSVHITAAERVPDTGRMPLQSTTPAYCVRDMGIIKLSVYNIQPHPGEWVWIRSGRHVQIKLNKLADGPK